MTIQGSVWGTISYPEHPDRDGAHGLQGGEDVYATRTTFRSLGEAMTWCRKVLDGVIANPRWEPVGELLHPHTKPLWSAAQVRATDRWSDTEVTYETDSADRGWYEGGNRRTEPARVDPE